MLQYIINCSFIVLYRSLMLLCLNIFPCTLSYNSFTSLPQAKTEESKVTFSYQCFHMLKLLIHVYVLSKFFTSYQILKAVKYSC